MPTVRETVRTYSGGSALGDRSSWRGWIVGAASLIGIILVLPPIASVERADLLWLVAVVVAPALGSAYKEYRFGGPPRLILVAALTSLVMNAIFALVFVGLWILVGGRLAFANPVGWFFRLPMEIQVGSLIGLMVLMVVGYFVRKAARDRAAEAFEARVRAERARRGLPSQRTKESPV
jgi:cation transport ATPase